MKNPMGRRPNEQRPEFGKHLLALRQKAGLSLEEAAAKGGISHTGLSKYERLGILPGRELIVALAEAYGITIEELLALVPQTEETRGMTGRVREVFEKVNKLPRKRKYRIAEIVEAMLEREGKAD